MKCDKCGIDFCAETEPGGLVISPPRHDGLHEQLHLCRQCHYRLILWMLKRGTV